MKLRELRREDWELVLAWRNSPLINKGFYSQSNGHLIQWDEHCKWIESRANWMYFIIEHEGRRIGGVTLGQLDHWSPEIGYFIGEVTLWGKGLGKQAVEMAIAWLKEKGYKYCHTTVLNDNMRSRNLLESLGFTYMAEARPGEVWMQKCVA